jgi:hypothetical protein
MITYSAPTKEKLQRHKWGDLFCGSDLHTTAEGFSIHNRYESVFNELICTDHIPPFALQLFSSDSQERSFDTFCTICG